MTQPETRIQRAIQRWLKEQGVFVFKVHGSEFMPAGLPDLVCCVKGTFVGIEVKTPDGEVSKVQAYRQRAITEAGGVVIVARSLDDVRSHPVMQGLQDAPCTPSTGVDVRTHGTPHRARTSDPHVTGQ